jgi:hypothetical protein
MESDYTPSPRQVLAVMPVLPVSNATQTDKEMVLLDSGERMNGRPILLSPEQASVLERELLAARKRKREEVSAPVDRHGYLLHNGKQFRLKGGFKYVSIGEAAYNDNLAEMLARKKPLKSSQDYEDAVWAAQEGLHELRDKIGRFQFDDEAIAAMPQFLKSRCARMRQTMKQCEYTLERCLVATQLSLPETKQ